MGVNSSQPKLSRLGGAILLSPPVGGVIGFAIMGVFLAFDNPHAESLWIAIPQFVLGMAAIGLVGGIVFGAAIFAVLWLPVHAALYHAAKRGLYDYILAGAISFLPLFAFSGLLQLDSAAKPFLLLIPHLCVGSAFWFCRRPDLDPPPTQSNTAP